MNPQLPAHTLHLCDLPDPREDSPPWRLRHRPGRESQATVTIPAPGRDHRLPVTLDGQIAARLAGDGPEIAHAYLLLASWAAIGEAVTIERYLLETWGSVDLQRVWPLVALHKRGLLISPAAADDRDRDAVEVLYGSRWLPGDDSTQPTPPNRIVPEQRRVQHHPRPRSRQVAPDPWPSYTGEQWTGTDVESARPAGRAAVVYCLYDANETLIYIGSTGKLHARLRGHSAKPWARYIAHGCRNRVDAYWLEAAAIRADRPPLNRDYWCAGKLDVVPATHVVSAGVAQAVRS